MFLLASQIPPDEEDKLTLLTSTVAIATPDPLSPSPYRVKALIMGSTGYRAADFQKTGGIMTVLFLTIMMIMMNQFY